MQSLLSPEPNRSSPPPAQAASFRLGWHPAHSGHGLSRGEGLRVLGAPEKAGPEVLSLRRTPNPHRSMISWMEVRWAWALGSTVLVGPGSSTKGLLLSWHRLPVPLSLTI